MCVLKKNSRVVFYIGRLYVFRISWVFPRMTDWLTFPFPIIEFFVDSRIFYKSMGSDEVIEPRSLSRDPVLTASMYDSRTRLFRAL